jgi:heme exporter protein D
MGCRSLVVQPCRESPIAARSGAIWHRAADRATSAADTAARCYRRATPRGTHDSTHWKNSIRQSNLLLLSLPVLALIPFAVPSRVEGPVLISISPGHGLSLVDLAAVVPLIAAVVVLAVSLVRRRAQLESTIRHRPWMAAAVLFGGGLGLGLLLASVFPFFWWWAVEATLFTVTLILVALAAARDVRGRRLGAHGPG